MHFLLKSCFALVEPIGEATQSVPPHAALGRSRWQRQQRGASCRRGGGMVRLSRLYHAAGDGRRHRLNGVGHANNYLSACAKWCAREVGLTISPELTPCAFLSAEQPYSSSRRARHVGVPADAWLAPRDRSTPHPNTEVRRRPRRALHVVLSARRAKVLRRRRAEKHVRIHVA